MKGNIDVISGNSAGIVSEIVVCDRQFTMQAHKDLFKYDEDRYIVERSQLVGILSGLAGQARKIHLSLSWHGMLKVSLWSENISLSSVLFLLKENGMKEEDTLPFKEADIEDIFHVLYYGKNYDILRRICNTAKRSAENNIGGDLTSVACHLVGGPDSGIVASSL
ncbi:MAG: hypothetical protein JSV21_09870 [Nitrospirota bacterium]|nr:MAG: hypothetical protein JSV21_09870 [Nitrospirota bacterium]